MGAKHTMKSAAGVFDMFQVKAGIVLIGTLTLLAISSGCDIRQEGGIGGRPPGISGHDIHGEYVSLPRFRGKVVVLYFWTNSCCGGKLKQMESFYSNNRPRGLALLAINVGNSREAVTAYAKDNGLTFTMLTDERTAISGKYGVFGFPTIFIIDRNGIIREKILGDVQAGKLEQLTLHYLNSKPEPAGEQHVISR